MKKQIFQLSVNEARTKFAFAEASCQFEGITILDFKTLTPIKVKIKGVVFLSWFSDDIVIVQTHSRLVKYNIKENKIEELCFLNKKIGMLLKTTENYIDYTSQLNVDIIEIYRFFYKDGTNQLLASFDTIKNNIVKKDVSIDAADEYMPIIEKELGQGAGVIFDNDNENSIIIINDKLNTSIYLNDKFLIELNGYIDRAFVHGKTIYISFSNFLNPRNVFLICCRNEEIIITDLEKNKVDLNFCSNIHVDFSLIGNRNVPVIQIKSIETTDKSLVFMHGGPDSDFKNEYLSFLQRTLDKKYSVYLVDYSGSTGYNAEYYKRLFNNNAEEAFLDIESVVNYLMKSGNEIILAGESFGGYLSVLSAIRLSGKIKRAISVNGFTDYRYQFLFSLVSKTILRYFDISISKNNPIDMVHENITVPIFFIHGENDLHCPIKQVKVFCKKMEENQNEAYLITIAELSHYSMNLDLEEFFARELINLL